MQKIITINGKTTNQLLYNHSFKKENIISVTTPFTVISQNKYVNLKRIIIKVEQTHYGLDYVDNHNGRMFFSDEKLSFREIILNPEEPHKSVYVSPSEEEKNSITYWENIFYSYPA